ncbi:hypothetical protein C8R46DRAFT_1363657 [Mycena filopes]|nr:hypothetical protein C8R46DRAFT_1363657 [Mycena filopes]
MAGLDNIFGALLLGTWMASLLFGLVVSEAYKYFTLLPNEPWTRKGLVILTLTFTVAALVGDYANTYLPTVTYWGNVAAIQKTYWPVRTVFIFHLTQSNPASNQLPLYSITNTLLAIIVDSCLIFRLYSLWKNIVVALVLYAILLAAFAGYLMGFIPLLRGTGSLSDREQSLIGADINFICVVVVDLATAAGLVWKLRSMRSNFSRTNSFLNRIMIGALQTGSATALCSALLLITFLHNPETNVATFFIFQFAPLYALTLLLNFNVRRESPGLLSASKSSASRMDGNPNILMDGVRIHRTAIVTMDPTDSETQRRMEQADVSSMKMKQDPESLQ